MYEVPHLPTAYIDLKAICHNYTLMNRHSGVSGMDGRFWASLPVAGGESERTIVWPSQMAVVKGDAYGHGHIRVSEALLQQGCTVFASGSVQEAVTLRQGLRTHSGNAGADGEPVIISLLGPVAAEDVRLCQAWDIIPLIHFREQFAMLKAAPGKIAVGIKCNTGMARLGFNLEELPDAVEELKHLPHVKPVLAVTHLHSADSGRYDVVLHQARIFADMLGLLRSQWPNITASMGNSAGTLLAGELASRIGPHICRPGVVLYGVNPYEGTAMSYLAQDILPAMSVCAPIIAVRDIPVGTSYGYGQTFVAEKPTTTGIVATGYADFFPRSLSGRGCMCVDNHRVAVIGRVSMQMTAVDISELLLRDSEHCRTAWILGGPHERAITVEELAQMWGTIAYETLCLMGYNERVYASSSTF